MPSKKKETREKNEAIPLAIFAYALRNAICRVSVGVTAAVPLKSDSISEAVQKAQRNIRPNELEKPKKNMGKTGEERRVVMVEREREA